MPDRDSYIQDPQEGIRQALKLARRAEELGEVPIGALILSAEGEVLGEGYNGRLVEKRTIAHAEIQAIEEYNRKTGLWRFYPGATLYVTTEPCLMCTGALLWARVDHIVYGCLDPKNAGLRRISSLVDDGVFDHRFKSIQGEVLAEECSSLLSGYFSQVRAAKRSELSSRVEAPAK